MAFLDRRDAGRRLASAMSAYKDRDPVVLALPRGGVPVAAEVADALSAPLDLVLVRKVGLPGQPELAIGAVVDGSAPLMVRNEDVIHLSGVSDAEFEAAAKREIEEIERRRRLWMGGRKPLDVAGRTAIVIDDGIATGATTRVALRATRSRGPSALILAVPVAPTDSVEALRSEADEVTCLETHNVFGAIGFYYDDFRQVSDDEVAAILQRFARPEGG